VYRSGNTYERIINFIIDIYIDYNIKSFPINEKEICKKMNVALIPYSEYSRKDRGLMKKKSKQGFFVPETKANPPTIFYNDFYESYGAVRFTIFHELKHYVCEDKDDKDDDLADFFSRYFMCPIPYLILKGIITTNDIMAYCNTSFDAASNASRAIKNRMKKYGDKIFDYEIRLINQIDPVLIEVYK